MICQRLDDKDGCQRLVQALQMNRAMTRYLYLVIQDGTSAENELQLRGSRID